jgi:molecular chaperone IbpA
MTQNYLPASLLSNTFFQTTIGYDRIFGELRTLLETTPTKPSNYPPHNIIQVDDHVFDIHVGVAGFDIEDLEVYTEKQQLVIKGKREHPTDENAKYIHRGLALRSFEKVIPIADTIELKGAYMNNGFLRITVENVVPEKDKRKQIEIRHEYTKELPTE